MNKKMSFSIFLLNQSKISSISFYGVYRLELFQQNTVYVEDSYCLYGELDEIIGFIPVSLIKHNLKVLRKYDSSISYKIDL